MFTRATPPPPLSRKIIPIAGDEIPSGTLVIADGKILAVGPSDSVQIPAGTKQVEAKGRVIMPGIICTHSHIGGIGGADGSGPIQPGVRILDSLNILDSGYKRALSGGLTTLNVMPGSGHLISGQTIYLKLRFGEAARQDRRLVHSRCRRQADGRIENGQRHQLDATRSVSRHARRDLPFGADQYIKAREYQYKIDQAKGDPDKLPARDLNLEALVEAMQGKRVVHHHTHRHDDIMTVLRLAQEFGFRVVLHHVSEGYKVADEIAKAKAPCSVILIDSPGRQARSP